MELGKRAGGGVGGVGRGALGQNVGDVLEWIALGTGVVVDALWLWGSRGGRDGVGEDGMVVGGSGDEATNRGIAVLLVARYAMLKWEEGKRLARALGEAKVDEEKEKDKDDVVVGNGTGQRGKKGKKQR